MGSFSLTATDWSIVASVPIVAFILGRVTKRYLPVDYVDYFLARRSFGTGRFLSTFLGSNLVFTAIFLELSLETARRGPWLASIPLLAFFLGTWLLARLYPCLAPYLEQGFTLHQALGEAFTPGKTNWLSIRRWAAIWTIVSFVGLVGTEFYGGILLLNWARVPLLASTTTAVTLAAVCAAFTIAGGLRGVALADVWLDVLTLTGAIVFVFVMLKSRLGGAQPISAGQAIAPLQDLHLADHVISVVAAMVLFVPMPLCALDTWQRGIAWKERTKVSSTLLGGATGIVAVAAAALLAGVYARRLGWALDGPPPLRLVLEHLRLPSIVTGLVVGGFIAMILSTADELLSCCAYAFLSDVLVLTREADPETKRRSIQKGKFYTGVFGFLAAALALVCSQLPDITGVLDVVFAAQVVFFFPLLLALTRSRSTPAYALTSLIATLLAFVAVLLSVGIGIAMGGAAGRELVDGSPILAFLVAGFCMLAGWGITSLRRAIGRSS